MTDILEQLDQVLAQRRQTDAGDSYVAGLHAAGLNRILEKVGEECAEVLLAAKDVNGEESRRALVSETADLWFHCMVMLSHLDSDSSQVLEELQRRFGLSGIEEKALRGKASRKASRPDG